MYLTENMPTRSAKWATATAIVAAALLACGSRPRRPAEAPRVNSYRLQTERGELAGTMTTVSGYLISTQMIGDDVCLRVLVDETLRFAPELIIAHGGHAAEPSPDLLEVYRNVDPRLRARTGEATRKLEIQVETEGLEMGNAEPVVRREGRDAVPAEPERDLPLDLRSELARAERQLSRHAASDLLRQAVVIQACKAAPTSTNRKAIRQALEWLEPLRKPKRIANAPDLASLRRELQVFYLERSRGYGWAELAWDEVVVTGVLLDRDAVFEDNIVGGVDLEPYLVGIHAPLRRRWLLLDLTYGDSVAKEVVFGVFREQAPAMFKRTGRAALSGALP